MNILSKNTPRWIILVIDIITAFFTAILAYLLRFNFSIPESEIKIIPLSITVLLLSHLLGFLFGKTHSSIIRYTSTRDTVRIITINMLSALLIIILNLISYYFINDRYVVPFSIIIIDFGALSTLMVFFRLLAKSFFTERYQYQSDRKNVILYGAGKNCNTLLESIQRNTPEFKIVGIIDKDSGKIGKKLDRITIYRPSALEHLLKTESVERVIITTQTLPTIVKSEIASTCLPLDVKVQYILPPSSWINGEFTTNQIRNLKIEDLLGREEIVIDIESITNTIHNKCVLITGASGSIGSELFRQVEKFSPKKVVLLDQAETPLFHLELEAEKKFPGTFEIVIADITNRKRIFTLFEKYKPEIVFHAAAYKHVPLMEANPIEAYHTNVIGTKNIAEACLENDVERFVMISTDKAVNPTNVMGASKRVAEIFAQNLNNKNETRFITTRFGNVLGSNGSVIPLFKKQIEDGGPLTVTHPKITRFFMTIPEACRLVMEAASMGEGGEIFLFDMGESVKIADLARKMIRLSGLTPDEDISIKYTGLRPGEKLYEELLNSDENTLPTHHPKIMVAKVKTYNDDLVRTAFEELNTAFENLDEFALIKRIKQLVPEYKSKNSKFEKLDN